MMNTTLTAMANPEFPFHNVSLLFSIIIEKASLVSVQCARAAKAHLDAATARYASYSVGYDLQYLHECVGVAEMVAEHTSDAKDRRFLHELVRVWDARILTGKDNTRAR